MSNAVFILLCFVLVFAPLAFGTVEQWAYTIMETVCFLALLLVSLRIYLKKQTYYYVPGTVPLFLFLGYIFFQVIPLPPRFIGLLSPSTYSIYQSTVLVADPSAWLPLSLNPKATLSEFFRFSSYAALYLVTVQLFVRQKILKTAVTIIVICASLIAFFAIIQHLTPTNKIYWFRELTQGGIPFGPYVNRNHYAGFMEMIFPLVVGLFLFYKPRVSYINLREKLAALFNLEKTNIYLLLGFSATLIGTSVFLSLSRSGIISLGVSMMLFGFMLLGKGIHRKRGIVIIAICMLITLSVGWFGWGPIIERFKTLYPVDGNIAEFRPIIWKDSMELLKKFLLTGAGFGSYVSVYPLYQTLPSKLVVDHAHNDYIELLSNGGITAFLLAILFLSAAGMQSLKTYQKRHELLSLYLFIGSITGAVSLLIHSVTDFNLFVGANGLYFFFLLGLTVSAANTRMREGLQRTYLRKMNMKKLIPVIVSSVLFFASVTFNIGILLGKTYDTEEKFVDKGDMSIHIRNKKNIVRASLFDPSEAAYHAALAQVELDDAKRDAAFRQYVKALRLDPLDGEYMQKLGLMLSDKKQFSAAQTLLHAGVIYDRFRPERYKIYALWLLSQGRNKDAVSIVQDAVRLNPHDTREYITLLIVHGVSDEEIFHFLPKKAEPYIVFAGYLQAAGKEKLAEEAYGMALQYIPNEEVMKPAYFFAIARYYMQQNLPSKALDVMRKAIEILPDDAGIRIQTAGLYEKMDIRYRAIEEYRHALIIDPHNERIRKHLDILQGKISPE